MGRRAGCHGCQMLLDDGDRAGLLALLALCNFELDLCTFFERAETAALNFGIVHEQIGTAFGGNEAITLFTVEPLDCALDASCHCYSLLNTWVCHSLLYTHPH